MNGLDIFVMSVVLFFWLLFFISYIHDRRKVSNGFLFFLAVVATVPAMLYFGVVYEIKTFLVLFILLFVIFLFFAVFGIFILIIGSLSNARILIRREGARFSNYLTLLLGVGLLFLVILPFLPLYKISTTFAAFFTSAVYIIAAYLGFIFFIFVVSSVLYLLYRPRYNKDYVVVLGSGLIDGYFVPPLLRSRIYRAIQFYDQQKKKTGRPPILVFSGGQGPDEWISEAEAMQKYALSIGIPKEHTLVEKESTTTYENMLFSKRLIERHFGDSSYRALFSTNNYHLFRASLFARMTRFNAQGIGAKTAWYYVPNAFLREYVAVLMMYRRWNTIIIGLLLTGTFFFTYVIQWIFQYFDVIVGPPGT